MRQVGVDEPDRALEAVQRLLDFTSVRIETGTVIVCGFGVRLGLQRGLRELRGLVSLSQAKDTPATG